MDSRPLFYEKQYFKQWWIFLLFISLLGMFIYACITQVGMGITFGNKPMGNTGLLCVTIGFIIFTVLFFRQCLFTKINEEGVYIKFRPYHFKWHFYPWEDIIAAEVKKYSPVSEYGGWGLRQGAYNVAGNMGLLLKFTKYDNLMIGTQKPEELTEVLKTLNKL